MQREVLTVNKNRVKGVMRGIVYWGLPVVIFYFIYKKIDISALYTNIQNTDVAWLLFGLSAFPLVILLGAYRWRLLLSQYNCAKIPFEYTLKHYWIGLPMGIIVPGSLGWDLYRVLVVGKRFGRYLLNIAAVMVEKVVALLICVSIIIVLFPLMHFVEVPLVLETILIVSYAALASLVLLGVVLLIIKNSKASKALLRGMERWLTGKLLRAACRIGLVKNKDEFGVPWTQVARPITNARLMLAVGTVTVLIQAVLAAASQILFVAIGYDISILVNFFAAPIFYLLVVLPISFGGLGVREVAYILIFGLFGVPEETALLVSLFAFSGMLVNYAIGGVLIAIYRSGVEDMIRRN